LTCKIDLNNIQTDHRQESILFATHDFIIYGQRHQIVLASCSGEILSSTKSSVDYMKHEYLDLGDVILFIFNGSKVTAIDKVGFLPIEHTLDSIKIGHCITKIFPDERDNQVIFGTKQFDRIQFVSYDFVANKRMIQTASWKASQITDMYIHNAMLYAILDNSRVVCCDMTTGETLWTRFEAAKIQRGMTVHDENFIYNFQGFLKIAKDKKTIDSIKIPLVNVSSIEDKIKNSIYVTSNDQKNICKYNLKSKILEWEILGHNPIQESVTTKGIDSGKEADVMFIRMRDSLGILNLTAGTSVSFLKIGNIHKITMTEDHVLVQKSDRTTTLIPGIREEQHV